MNQTDSILVTDVRPKLLFASLYLRGYVFSKFKETDCCQMVQQRLRLEEILQHLNTTQSSCDTPFQILETCLEANLADVYWWCVAYFVSTVSYVRLTRRRWWRCGDVTFHCTNQGLCEQWIQVINEQLSLFSRFSHLRTSA